MFLGPCAAAGPIVCHNRNEAAPAETNNRLAARIRAGMFFISCMWFTPLCYGYLFVYGRADRYPAFQLEGCVWRRHTHSRSPLSRVELSVALRIRHPKSKLWSKWFTALGVRVSR